MIEQNINTVYHCDSKEKAKEFCKKLDELGYEWNSLVGLNYTKYENKYTYNSNYKHFKENTCYNPRSGTCDHINYFKAKGYKIIEYKLDATENSKASIKKAILDGNLFDKLNDYNFYKNIEFEEMKELAKELAHIIECIAECMLEEKGKGMSLDKKQELIENLGLNEK